MAYPGDFIPKNSVLIHLKNAENPTKCHTSYGLAIAKNYWISDNKTQKDQTPISVRASF